MNKFQVWSVLLGVVLLSFGCDKTVVVSEDLQSIDQKLVTFPRFPEARFDNKFVPVLPVSVDSFVILRANNSSNVFINDDKAQFEFSALELNLQYWSLSQENLRVFNGAKKITKIGDEVHFFANQKLHSLEVVGELSDYLLLKIDESGFAPDLIGQPVFDHEGQVVGLIHSFDIEHRQLRVLKYKVIRDFWEENR